MLRKIIELGLALAMLAPLSIPRQALAVDLSGDIPGEQLSGNTVASAVGGPVVDQVYEIVVQRSSAVTVSLRGEVGAELGLYLFDALAVSILRDTPIRTSAKPGAIQYITFASPEGGTYYLNINGRNTDRSFLFTLTIASRQDDTPPRILSLGPPRYAQSAHVCMSIAAADPVSGVELVQVVDLSNQQRQTFPYTGAGRYCVPLDAGDGKRALSVSVTNGVGMRSAAVRTNLSVDDTPPNLLTTQPKQEKYLFSGRAGITWEFNEAVRFVDGSGSEVFALKQDGVRVPGAISRSSDGRVFTWQSNDPIELGSLLLVNLPAVSDAAGNSLNFVDTLVVYRKNRTTIGSQVVSRTQSRVVLNVEVSANLVGKPIVIQRRFGNLWVDWKTTKPASRSIAISVPRGDSVGVRIVWAGSERLAPSQSPARSY